MSTPQDHPGASPVALLSSPRAACRHTRTPAPDPPRLRREGHSLTHPLTHSLTCLLTHSLAQHSVSQHHHHLLCTPAAPLLACAFAITTSRSPVRELARPKAWGRGACVHVGIFPRIMCMCVLYCGLTRHHLTPKRSSYPSSISPTRLSLEAVCLPIPRKVSCRGLARQRIVSAHLFKLTIPCIRVFAIGESCEQWRHVVLALAIVVAM